MDAYESYRSHSREGLSGDEILDRLKLEGFSIMDVIKAVRRERRVSLAEAKQVVEQHPSWASIVDEAEPLRYGLEQAFLKGSERS